MMNVGGHMHDVLRWTGDNNNNNCMSNSTGGSWSGSPMKYMAVSGGIALEMDNK